MERAETGEKENEDERKSEIAGGRKSEGRTSKRRKLANERESEKERARRVKNGREGEREPAEGLRQGTQRQIAAK